MTNRALYLGMLAFAAAAAASAQSTAKAETPGHATLMELIREDLDQNQAAFTQVMTERTGRKINARQAKLDNVFAPLIAAAPQDAGNLQTPPVIIAFNGGEY